MSVETSTSLLERKGEFDRGEVQFLLKCESVDIEMRPQRRGPTVEIDCICPYCTENRESDLHDHDSYFHYPHI